MLSLRFPVINEENFLPAFHCSIVEVFNVISAAVVRLDGMNYRQKINVMPGRAVDPYVRVVAVIADAPEIFLLTPGGNGRLEVGIVLELFERKAVFVPTLPLIFFSD